MMKRRGEEIMDGDGMARFGCQREREREGEREKEWECI